METQEYLQRQKELLARLSQVNNEDFKTKKEIIQDLIDVTRPLLKAGYYNWKRRDFASYIHQQLLDYNIEYPRGETFYTLFKDEEKRDERSNIESQNEIHKHEFAADDDTPKIKRCVCGVIRFNDIIYDVEDITIDTTDFTKNITTEDKPDPYSNPVTELFQRVKFNCDELGSQCSDLIKKYYASEEIAKTIDKVM